MYHMIASQLLVAPLEGSMHHVADTLVMVGILSQENGSLDSEAGLQAGAATADPSPEVRQQQQQQEQRGRGGRSCRSRDPDSQAGARVDTRSLGDTRPSLGERGASEAVTSRTGVANANVLRLKAIQLRPPLPPFPLLTRGMDGEKRQAQAGV